MSDTPTLSCSHCDANFDPAKLITRGELKLCAPCDSDHAKCCNCSDYFPNDDLVADNSGDLYCEACRDDCLAYCEKCDNYFPNDNIIELSTRHYNPSRIITEYRCKPCAEQTHFQCHACDIWCSNDDSCTGPDDNSYCENCAETFTHCDECSETIWNDDARGTDEGLYCSSCYDDLQSEDNPVLADSRYRRLESTSFSANPFKRTVGIELEYIQASDASIDLTGFGVSHDDGSVHPKDGERGQGAEFSTHAFNGDRLFTSIDTICASLLKAKSIVNTTCGLHVHIDMKQNTSEEFRQNVYRAFWAFESIFLGMVSASRQSNQYCQPISQLTSFGRYDRDRYRTLNLAAFGEHGTFEYRLHQGSLNAGKIKAWVSLLLNFTEIFGAIDITDNRMVEINRLTDVQRLRLFFQLTPISFSLKRYIVKRLREFGRYALKPARIPSRKRPEVTQCAA